MSIAGGFHHAFVRGARAGCRTLQIFLKNSNQWKGKNLTEEDRELFRAAQAESGIRPVVAHNSYLINLASPDTTLYQKSLEAFVEEIRRADFLGVPLVVLHPGAHMGAGATEGISRVARALNTTLARVEAPVRILLETTAGQGTCLGHKFEHLAAILDRIRDSDRVGICVDTCHVFAAGYDIRTERGYRQTMRELDRLIGTERICVVHVNDCKKGLGCRVDRHAHIGKGFIGLGAFRYLLNDRRFASVPKILETPKGKDLAEDKMNLATLRMLASRLALTVPSRTA